MNEKEFFRNNRKFKLDYKRLYRWYLATLLSYDNSISQIEKDWKPEYSFTVSRKKVFFKEDIYEQRYLIQHDISDLYRKYKKGYSKFLNEMVLIRLVSLMEVYLTSMIETCFWYDKTLFYTQEKTTLTVSEFLIMDKEKLEDKFISTISSQCSHGGINELTKFYKNTFNINFNDFNANYDKYNYNFKEIQKLHDTRHLIIHKLGETDDKYCSKYKYSGKKIELDVDGILYYLNLINYFNEFLYKQFQNKIINNDKHK